MANAYARAGTLVANVVTSVTLRGSTDGVWVVNRSQSGQIWVRLDGVAPTVAGADCFVVLGARNFPVANVNVIVQMISSSTPDYSVEGLVVAT